ncbi:hypothetical protein MCEZLEM10_00599 [Methylophilaceae bacterium]
MNKILASLLAGSVALAIGSTAFAADAAKPVDATKVETVAPAKADPVKTEKKKSSKKAKDEAKPAEVAPVAK